MSTHAATVTAADLSATPAQVSPPTRPVRLRHAADGSTVAEAALQLSGLHCAACAGVIAGALQRVPGVLCAEVDAMAERAHLRWSPEATGLDALIAAVRSAGYDAVADDGAQAAALRSRERRLLLVRWCVAVFCAMQVMMLATPGYLAGAGDIAPDLRRLLALGGWVLTLPVMGLSATPFFAGAWRSLRSGRIGMDVPVALGLAVTFVASSVATFHPGGVLGSEVYFDSLTMFVAVVLGARWLEMRARHRAAERLEQALRELPRPTLRIDADGVARSIDARDLVPGDTVLVALGQAFPADGRLTQGSTAADESLLSGESWPIDKAVGATVITGSLNVGAPVTMRVEQCGADTAQQAIVDLVRSAATQRPGLARAADRWAAPFLWVVLLLAAGAAAAWSVIDPSRALWVAVSVLIVTCPCALALAVPASLLSAAAALARRGVLLRRLDLLDALSRVSEVFFDKTGTLTDDRLALHRVVAIDASTPSEAALAALAAQAASLACASVHPLARALTAAYSSANAEWAQVREVSGAGLQGVDAAGRLWRLGSARHVGVSDEPSHGAALWFGCDDGPRLRFDFNESLRPDAVALVARWRALGIKVTLLTGDRSARASDVGRALGVDAVVAEATPQTKLQVVAQAQARGAVVAMVGDGINDAPVLARADVALAMGHGALLARAHADAVITGNRLADLEVLRRIAQRTRCVVRQNIVWAAGYNMVSVPLALTGHLPPWAAGLGMALSSLLVIGNALRLSRLR